MPTKNTFLQKKITAKTNSGLKFTRGTYEDNIYLDTSVFRTDTEIKKNLTQLLELANYETVTNHEGDFNTLDSKIDDINSALSLDTQKLKTDVATLKNTVGAITSFEYKVVKTDPTKNTPTESDKGKIYLFKDTHSDANDNYDEYLAVDVDGVLQWEKIGNTDVNLTNYVTKDFTIAGLDLQDNITMEELRDAIGSGTYFIMNKDDSQPGQYFKAEKGYVNFGYVVKCLLTPGNPTSEPKFPDKDGIIDISDLSKSVKLNGSSTEQYDASSGIISIPNVVTGIKTPSGLTASNTAHSTETGAYKGLVDLSHLVPDTRTIMGIDLKDNITKQEVADAMEAYYNSFPNLMFYKHVIIIRKAEIDGNGIPPSFVRIVDYSTNPFYYFNDIKNREDFLTSLEDANAPLTAEKTFSANTETLVKVATYALDVFKNDTRRNNGFSAPAYMHSGEWNVGADGAIKAFAETVIYEFGSVTGAVYDKDGDYLPITSAFINFGDDSRAPTWTEGTMYVNNDSLFLGDLFIRPRDFDNGMPTTIFESVTPMWGNPFRRTTFGGLK